MPHTLQYDNCFVRFIKFVLKYNFCHYLRADNIRPYRLFCVCTQNKWRSLTAATVIQQLSYKQKTVGKTLLCILQTVFPTFILHFQFHIINYTFPISSYLSKNETFLSPCLYEMIVSRLTFSTLWKMLLSICGLIFFRLAISCLISCRFEPVLLFGEQVVQVSVKRHAH